MITGELKNKIDSLWDVFASGGLVNPLDVIEQITYLMFIHDLDDTDNLRAANFLFFSAKSNANIFFLLIIIIYFLLKSLIQSHM